MTPLDAVVTLVIVTMGITGLSVARDKHRAGEPWAVHAYGAAFFFGIAIANLTSRLSQ